MKLALFDIDIDFELESLSVEQAKSFESFEQLLLFAGGERTLVLLSAQNDQISTVLDLADGRNEIIPILVGTEEEFEIAGKSGISTAGFLVAPISADDIEELLSDFSLAYRPKEVDPSDFDESNSSEGTMPDKKDEIELGDFSDASMEIDASELDSDDELSFGDDTGTGLELGNDSEVMDLSGDDSDDSEVGISLEELGDSTDLELSDDESSDDESSDDESSDDEVDLDLSGDDSDEDEVDLDDGDDLEFDLSSDDEEDAEDEGSSSISFDMGEQEEVAPVLEASDDATGEFSVDLTAEEEDEDAASGPIEFGYKDDEDDAAELAGNTTEFSVDGEEEGDDDELDFSSDDDETEAELDLSGDDDDDDDIGFDLSEDDDDENEIDLSGDDEDLNFDAVDELDENTVEIPSDLPADDIPAPQAEKSVTGTVLNSAAIRDTPVQVAPIQTTIVRDKIDYTFDENEMVRLQVTIRSMKEEREKLLSDLDQFKANKTELEQNNLGLKAEVDDLRIELALLKKRHGEQIEEASYQLRLSEDRKILYEERVRKMQIDFDQLNQKVRIDLNKVKHKEKELESQLELIKMDSDAQIKGRDQKIMELKRKIDSLEFNMENMAIKEQKSKDDHQKVEERVQKVMKTLKGSMKLLEDDIDFAITDNKGDSV